MKKAYTTKTTKGFTLVELLVVIAIIGLLAVIGIPAILNAQRASRNTAREAQLDAVRGGLASYYTKYFTDGSVYDSNSCASTAVAGKTTVYVGESGKCSRAIPVDLPVNDGYSLTLSAGCATPSKDKTITYYVDSTNGIIYLCKEPSGSEAIPYR